VRAQDGKLATVRQEVRTGTDSAQAADDKGSKSSSEDRDDDCLDDLCDSLFLGMFSAYGALVKESFSVPSYFPRHPYADGFSGYLRVDRKLLTLQPEAPALPLFLQDTKTWSCRCSLEDGNDFNGLNRVGGQVLLDTSYHVGCLIDVNYFNEDLGAGRRDQLLIGDANLVVSLIRMRKLEDRVGVGLRYLADDYDTNFGVNVLYGVDWFPIEPLVVSWQIDGGTLGHAGVFHFRATAGCCCSHAEAFVGYDYLRIGSQDLQGPMIGFRLWF
jgi:hypothetical protein